MFDGNLYLARDICKDEQIPEQLKVSVKSKPAKPAAKSVGKQAAQSALASFSNPQPVLELPTEHVLEFKVVWTRKKKFRTVPVERACVQRYHHVSMGLILPAFCMQL